MSTSRVKGWSDARYWGYIRSLLRKGFGRYPPKYQTLAASKEGRNVYRCNECGSTYGKKDVAVDHVTPCGTLKSYEDLPSFVDNMFTDNAGLQVLCKECHYIKTMKERGMTDTDIQVAGFKKLAASGQKFTLAALGMEEVGKNQDVRVEQYRRYVDGTPTK